jgi:DNA polymerase
MTELHLDLETRSTVDLRKSGVYPYAMHPDTDVWVACWSIGDDPVQAWYPGQPCPPALAAHVEAGGDIYAHNAQFERVNWLHILGPRYGWPMPKLEQWHCTAAMAAAMALPRDLAGAGKALGLDVQKDKEGAALMLRMARPRKTVEKKIDEACTNCRFGLVDVELCPVCDGTGHVHSTVTEHTWWNEPAKLKRLTEYCVLDVEVERLLTKKLRPLPPIERQIYLADQRINDRGVTVDLELVHAAQRMAALAAERLDARITEATGWQVTKTTKASDLTKWLGSQGVDAESVDKATVRELLAGGSLPDHVREVVEMRQAGAKSSTAKLKAMVSAACPDGKARGMFLYHAASTGRVAGRLIQLQNMPRGTVEGVENAIPLILSGDIDLTEDLFGSALDVISSALRSMLTASPGNRLIFNDYSSVEGRVLAWLGGERWVLDAYVAGTDLYKATYSRSFGVPIEDVTKAQRQIGKAADLGLGFGGGAGAFATMASVFGVHLPDEEVEKVKVAFRESRPNTVQLWRDCEDAAINSIRNPGKVTAVAGGKLRYVWKGGYLWCVLPSGRALAYPGAGVTIREMPWKDRKGNPVQKESVYSYGVNAVTRQWEKQWLYGGLLAQNATQAVARDICMAAILRCEENNYRICMSVHDELVADVPVDFGSPEEMGAIMCQSAGWDEGLPLAVSADFGFRYRK